jgi:hypothetical protein
MNIVSNVDFNKLSFLTDAIQLVPNQYGRLGELGIFRLEPSARGGIIFDRTEQEIGLLADTSGKGNKQLSSKDHKRETFSLTAPEFNYSDFMTVEDIDRVRKVGEADQPELLADIQERKLTKLRRKHEQTHEFLRMGALKGVTVTPDGRVYANMFTEFGVTPKVINFTFTDVDLDIQGLCRDMLRHMEDNAQNGSWAGAAHQLVSPEFFDALTSHPKTFEAYNQYENLNQVANAQVNRDDLGRVRFGRTFFHCGVMFEEYRATAKYNGVSVKFIETGVGYGYPMGLEDLFVTYALPAKKFDSINGLGQETYAWQHPIERGEQAEIESYSSVLPVCRHPQTLVKVTGSY